jgi:hypothetical protein
LAERAHDIGGCKWANENTGVPKAAEWVSLHSFVQQLPEFLAVASPFFSA